MLLRLFGLVDDVGKKYDRGPYIYKSKNNKASQKPKAKQKLNLFVARIDKTGQFVDSKPCRNCLEFIKTKYSAVISHIYYTIRTAIEDDNTKFVKESVAAIESEHLSRRNRT